MAAVNGRGSGGDASGMSCQVSRGARVGVGSGVRLGSGVAGTCEAPEEPEGVALVWPALLLFVARGRRRWVGAVLIAVLAGSFAANLYLTETSISWAFYSLPDRKST